MEASARPDVTPNLVCAERLKTAAQKAESSIAFFMWIGFDRKIIETLLQIKN